MSTAHDAVVHTQAGQGVLAVNVHGTATADPLTATSSESQGRVELVLDTDEGVQDHGSSLVQVNGIGLHSRLFGRGVGIPSVDLECLHVWSLLMRGLADRCH